MEMVIETIPVPERLNRSSECQIPTSDQEPEISGTADRPLTVPESPNQIGKENAGSETATPVNQTDLETPDRRNQSAKLNSDCKTATPVEQTDEKQGVSVPRNGSADRLMKVPKSPNPSAKPPNFDCKTPTPVKQIGPKPKFSGIELPKNGTPDRLKVPKAFKYPERYKSPTDLMMSPITKGLLARSRKGGVLNQLKALSFNPLSTASLVTDSAFNLKD